MPTRRAVLAGATAAIATPAMAQGSFESFVAGLRAEAPGKGISPATVDRAFAGVHPNPRVVELDAHQPEFTLTWQQYRSRLVSDSRVARGRELYQAQRPLLQRVAGRYGVPPSIIMGIWGLESDYGRATGGFNVIEALGTLAWEGRRTAFFRSELWDALRILDHGDIAPARMTGSYAGAMGQTQFMPDSFLKYAVPGESGRRDIWDDYGSVFASTANYLTREGWQAGLPWGEPIAVPPGLADPYETGRDHRKPVAEWLRRGVRTRDGRPPLGRPDAMAAVLLPGGANDEAFFAYYPSFLAIRRYNPSDFYCICVGLIGDRVTA